MRITLQTKTLYLEYKMNSEEQFKLQDEIARGGRAQQAYDLYLKDHFETVRKQLFDSFCRPDVDDENTLNIKKLALAINGLENSIMSDIDNAKVALKQLEEVNSN